MDDRGARATATPSLGGPNTRMQRTRSSPSALRSPLMRCPLGDQGSRVARIALGLAMLVASGRQLPGWATATADEGRRHLLEDELRVITTTREIPDSVIARFAELTKTKGVVFAQPGAKYQETDVVSEPGLPQRRLIFAGLGKGLCVLYYERGGIGHSEHVMVFQVGQEGSELMWGAILKGRANSLEELRDAVRKGDYGPNHSF